MSETVILEAAERVRTAHQTMIAAEKAYWQATQALHAADTERVRARNEENEATFALKAAIVVGIPDDRVAYFQSMWSETELTAAARARLLP